MKPISDADILATLEHLPEVVADMVQLQRLTGARPGEICDIRPGDINRTGDVWEYIPDSHKTEHHDKPRVIFIGAKGQRILLPYLLRAADAYCFSPREAEGKRRAAQHEARKVPMSCGNRPGTNRKRKPRRTAGEKYDPKLVRSSDSPGGRKGRRRHVVPASTAAYICHRSSQVVWPGSGASLLGTQPGRTSEIYAERDFAKAANVARQIG